MRDVVAGQQTVQVQGVLECRSGQISSSSWYASFWSARPAERDQPRSRSVAAAWRTHVPERQVTRCVCCMASGSATMHTKRHRRDAPFTRSDAREAAERVRVCRLRALFEVRVPQCLFGRDALVGVISEELREQVQRLLGAVAQLRPQRGEAASSMSAQPAKRGCRTDSRLSHVGHALRARELGEAWPDLV